MTASRPNIFQRYLRQELATHAGTPRSDRVLVDCFVVQHDQGAFAELVQRHGAMVLAVCRRVLRDGHLAEDVFQATFLVLARKAGSIARSDALRCWLYGVAYRLALKARAGTIRRLAHESWAGADRSHVGHEVVGVAEWQALVDEELARLPEKYRAPLVLCYLQEQTRDAAAQELGWSLRRLKYRLERGRSLLRARLVRRGLAVPSGLFVTEMVKEPAQAVSARLTESTITAGMQFMSAETLTGASATAAALARGMIRGTLLLKLNIAAGTLLAAVLLVTTAAVVIAIQPTVEQAARQEPTPLDSDGPQANNAAPPSRLDLLGDPLPPGAVARLGTLRFRHGAPVSFVAFAPDGKSLASAGKDKTVRLWDVSSGKEIRAFIGHQNLVHSVAFAPDRKSLASASDDNTVRLWDVASGREIHSLRHEGGALSVAYAPDGKTLASAGFDKTVRLWDVASGREIRAFIGHRHWVLYVAYAPDGKTLASASRDSTLRLWDVASGKEKTRADDQLAGGDGPQSRVVSVVYAPDGKTLASAGNVMRLWDAASGREIRAHTGQDGGAEPDSLPSPVVSVAYAPDGKTLAAAGQDKKVRLWDVATGKEIRAWAGNQHGTLSLAYAPDGKTLASAGWDSRVRLWDVATGQEIRACVGHQNEVYSVAYAPDGKTLASAGKDKTVRLWDVGGGQEIRACVGHQDGVTSVAYAPDGKALASASYDRTVRLWKMASGQEIRACAGHQSWVHSVAYAPDGKTLASASFDSTVRLWDVAGGKEIRACAGHQEGVSSVAYAPDGKTLASAGHDKTLRLWDLASGQQIRMFVGHQGVVSSVAFKPDGRTLASAGYDSTVRLWDVASGREIGACAGHQGRVNSVAFAPNGKTLASAGEDNMVCLWDVATGKQIHKFVGHHDEVLSVAYSPDGKSLASASADATLLIWDLSVTGGQRAAALAPRGLQSLWDDLPSADARRAYRAIDSLIHTPQQSVAFLRDRVQPIPAPDAARLKQLLVDLDSDQFAVRQKAAKALEEFGDLAEPALRGVLEGKPSLEMAQRVNALLDKLPSWQQSWSEERLRMWRVIQVLEGIGTEEAQAVLKTLAGGAPGSRLTQEAKASFERLAKRASNGS